MEFALEDARVMRVREVRKKRREPDSGGQRGAQNSGSRGNDEIVEATVGRKSKKVEWQLKCKEKRLRRREKKTDLTHSQEVSRGDKKKVREDGEMCENGDVRRGASTNKKQVASEKNGQQFVGGNKKKGSVNGQTRKFESTVKHFEPASKTFGTGSKNFDGVAHRKRKLHHESETEVAGGEKRVKLSRRQSRKVCHRVYGFYIVAKSGHQWGRRKCHC